MSIISWLKSIRQSKTEVTQSVPVRQDKVSSTPTTPTVVSDQARPVSGHETAFAPRFGGGYGGGGVPDMYGRFGGPR